MKFEMFDSRLGPQKKAEFLFRHAMLQKCDHLATKISPIGTTGNFIRPSRLLDPA